MAEYQGFPVNYDQIPDECRAPVDPDITKDDFKIRLKAGGTLTLDGADMIIGQPSYDKNTTAFIALDKLELKNGAKIVTNGNLVTIFANTLSSDNCSIVSFLDSNNKARAGSSGSGVGESGLAGDPGDSGGVVSIHVIESFQGRLNANLNGQNGGDGGSGAKGGTGVKGMRGGDAADQWWPFPGCKFSGGNGGQGGIGGPGGHGGNGGHGGHGGVLYLFNVGQQPIPQVSYSFVANGGNPGNPGTGGNGGDGGPGGEGGSGSTYCGGGSGGPQGPSGPKGNEGEPGRTGAPGSAIVKNIDLDLVLRRLPRP